MRWPCGLRSLAVDVAALIRIEKLMSLTLSEFQLTLAPLTGAPLATHLNEVEIPLGPGHVAIHYEARPSARLGGLLVMPRALVSLTFLGVPEPEQRAFLKRFELTFQRGGG